MPSLAATAQRRGLSRAQATARTVAAAPVTASGAVVLLLVAWTSAVAAAPHRDVGVGAIDVESGRLVLSNEEGQLRKLFPDGSVELYNDDTALLFSSDVVYQIDIPQVSSAAKVDFARVDVTADFDAFDSDRDGSVSLREFVEASGAAANAAAVYESLDGDHDRSINRKEFERAPWRRRNGASLRPAP